MLILTRKLNEKIRINDSIEIMVVSVNGDQVKLGISAPQDVKIYRSEVYEEIQKQNQASLNCDISLKLQNNIKKLNKN